MNLYVKRVLNDWKTNKKKQYSAEKAHDILLRDVTSVEWD